MSDSEPPDPGAIDADPSASITQLLILAKAGDGMAWNAIYTLLYAELHKLARSLLWGTSGHTLSATALINETWLRLALARSNIDAADRRQLVGLIARAMRSAILDETRNRLALKRGYGLDVQSLSDSTESPQETRLEQMIALDGALNDLAEGSPRLAQIVEWRYFGGLGEAEIAALLDQHVRTVRRDWRTARAFLLQRLGDDHDWLNWQRENA